MAAQLCLSDLFQNSRRFILNCSVKACLHVQRPVSHVSRILAVRGLLREQKRCYAPNPLERRSIEALMASVSGGRFKGRKKGGKRKFRRETFVNLGQGLRGERWPGLSAPIPTTTYGPNWIKEKELEMRVVKGDEKEWEESRVLNILPGERRSERRLSEMNWSPRGWTGRSWGGRHVGCPELPNGDPIPEFDSVVIEVRRVAQQTTGGKRRSLRTLVVVGNGNGAIGFAIGKDASDTRSSIRKAKNKAIMHLHFVPKCDNHTIYHHLEAKFKRTRVIMERKVPGYGLVCHRAIAVICKLVGIKDIYAKVLGSTNPMNVVQAAVKALESQTTHEELAQQSGLHVVEMRRECDYRPVVVASPENSEKATLEAAKQFNLQTL